MKSIIDVFHVNPIYHTGSFAGTGTMGYVAKGLQRKWIMIEQNKKYADKLKKRLERGYDTIMKEIERRKNKNKNCLV